MKDIKSSQISTEADLEVFSNEEKGMFNTFFEGLKLSKQMSREFKEWLPEIAYAEEISIKDILNSVEMIEIKNSEKLNGPQKLAKFREVLYTKRYPELSSVKSDWQKLTKEINPDITNVQFKSDPYFEKSEVEIKIIAKSSQELKQLLNSLINVDDKVWDKIIDPFKGIK